MPICNILTLTSLLLSALAVVALVLLIPLAWLSTVPAVVRRWCALFGCRRQERKQ